jgi:hypothetical protein
MDNVPRYCSAFVHVILLIVIAVHGLTPDANALASLRGLNLLYQISTDREPDQDDTVPESDEVCRPARDSRDPALLEFHLNATSAEYVAPRDCLPACIHLATSSRVGGPEVERNPGVTIALCRRRC